MEMIIDACDIDDFEFESAFRAASRSGHLEAAQLLLRKTDQQYYLSSGVECAGQLELISLLTETERSKLSQTSGEGAVTAASKNGHLGTVVYLLEALLEDGDLQLTRCVELACKNRHTEVFNYLKSKWTQPERCFVARSPQLMRGAAKGGHFGTVQQLVTTFLGDYGSHIHQNPDIFTGSASCL